MSDHVHFPSTSFPSTCTKLRALTHVETLKSARPLLQESKTQGFRAKVTRITCPNRSRSARGAAKRGREPPDWSNKQRTVNFGHQESKRSTGTLSLQHNAQSTGLKSSPRGGRIVAESVVIRASMKQINYKSSASQTSKNMGPQGHIFLTHRRIVFCTALHASQPPRN